MENEKHMQWEVFFGPDNDEALQWATLSAPGNAAGRELKPFLELVERRAPVAALPRIHRGSTKVFWYIGWRDESNARFAQDLLRAFLGRTYAAMKEPVQRLEPADAAEQAFAEEFDGMAFRLEVGWAWREEARGQLLRLGRLIQERPERLAPKVRPVGRILRDLELALRAGDGQTARIEIGILRGGGHLDEANLAFLELRSLGVSQDWAGVLAHDALPSLLGFRSIPWQVGSLLLSALFHQFLAEPVAAGDLSEALRRVESLLPEYRVAFASRRHIVGVEATVAFLLADGLRTDMSPETLDARLVEVEAAGFTRLAEEFRRRFGLKSATVSTLPELTIAAAQNAMAEGDLDRAFTAAAACPPSVARALLLLQCAALLDDEAASVEAMAACDRLSSGEKTHILSFGWCRATYQHLAAELGAPASAPAAPGTIPAPTDSWRAWFARLRRSENWPGAVSRAAAGTTDWNVEDVAAQPDALSEIVETAVANLVPWAADALRQALPYLLDAFLRDPPDPRLASLVDSLFEVLATDDTLSLASASALIRLAQYRIAGNPAAYAATVEAIAAVVEQVGSLRSVRLVAEGLELLVTTSPGTGTTQTTAALRMATAAGRWWMRMDAVDRALVRALCVDLDVQDVLPSDPEAMDNDAADDGPWGATLEGRFVALYSLTQSALDRTAAALQVACPGVRVKVFCELVGTVSMRDAARTADLFVIATRSAAHAATGFITQNRKGAVEYAGGKGSATLIDAVRRWAESGSRKTAASG